ncbi:hypothetical protein [Paraglaciecola psychrophila]|uniref:Phytase-like domain-containing protein n=1 Tax=Paraglaciecola psychrophila 170 TaxID=1129794 RepID=K7A2B4_9ALTE|nr:hypothetical protein [Paraglaciecola psychrophila]AGH47341.1 hypothetical protein C427_5244 [Paraglaciecola psychrophila 170]GAC36527.1 hypothetical protein GPSY_0889 [Paraglaciecola psychrophila 170]
MRASVGFMVGICSLLVSCGKTPESTQIEQVEQNLQVNGHWIVEQDGQVMLNPQTSGLVKWRDDLLTLSDRSAHPSQRLRLRTISKDDALLSGPDLPMILSEILQTSCFAAYISDNPDFEALVVDPDDDNVIYVVTEDATYAEPMSETCQQKYLNSGSTIYPTLLVRLELQANNTALMTHIRPIQFTADMQIGNFPNDGVEALAFGQARTLYIGIEKDNNKQARIFSLQMGSEFWHSDEFAVVSNFSLKLPVFDSGNHPINGMDYYQTPDGRDFLLVAARNDETLWVVDLLGEKETVILGIDFFAEIQTSSVGCENYEVMDNASIEGVAVMGNTLWLINDPWKAVYINNIQCDQNRAHYQIFAPLLFSVPIQSKWFD